jgi:alkylated DNA repair protein alkB family protein 7
VRRLNEVTVCKAAMFMLLLLLASSSSLHQLTRGACKTVSRQKSDVTLFPAKRFATCKFPGGGEQRHRQTTKNSISRQKCLSAKQQTSNCNNREDADHDGDGHGFHNHYRTMITSSLVLPAIRSGFICSQNSLCYRLLSNAVAFDIASTTSASPDPRYVNLRHAPVGFDVASAVVYPRFLTEDEGKSLVKEVGQRMKRRRFENGHWDSVITCYREVELPDEQLSSWQGSSTDSTAVSAIHKTRIHLENTHINCNRKTENDGSLNVGRWLPCHAIDLSAQGELSAHVDSVKFSGDIVAGLSLLSDAIMRLRPSSPNWESGESKSMFCSDNASNGYVDLYLPQLSLYVLSGMSRYDYTHELLPSRTAFEFVDDTQSNTLVGESVDVVRGRRLSIIFRDRKRN